MLTHAAWLGWRPSVCAGLGDVAQAGALLRQVELAADLHFRCYLHLVPDFGGEEAKMTGKKREVKKRAVYIGKIRGQAVD